LQLFKWRPRPSNLLKAAELTNLKRDYKTKYAKKFKEEEITDKKVVTEVVRHAKKKIRDEFLETFFLPLRKEFEENKDKYEALWPLKADDFLEEPVTYELVYSYDNVVSEKRF